MTHRTLSRILNFGVLTFVLGSLVLTAILYFWRVESRSRYEKQTVARVGTAFAVRLDLNTTQIVFDLNNYNVILPTPGATDGDSETVVRVSDANLSDALEFLLGHPQVADDAQTAKLPPWKSLFDYFALEPNDEDCIARLYIHDTWEDGELSNCELLILSRKKKLLGFYRWDQ